MDSVGIDLDDVLSESIDWRYKAWPQSDRLVLIRDVPAQHWNALSGDFSLPVLVLKDSALQHNIDLVADYCKRNGVSLAPHAKTPVAPQIARRQLAAGAWAISVANFHQARLFRKLGLQRILMANELVEREPLAWAAREIAADPSFEIYCLVDSVRGIELMEAHLRAVGFTGKLAVLIELGVAGGRCGCRTLDEAMEVAARLANSTSLHLAGIEAYEGMVQIEELEPKLRAIDVLCQDVRRLAELLDQRHCLPSSQELLVTVGGSLFVDRVVQELSGGWDLTVPVRVVVRCGAYVTHDIAENEKFSPFAGRSQGGDHLRQALELWAIVVSRPEPNFAVVGFGKRDVAHDRGWPKAFEIRRSGQKSPTSEAQIMVLSLNDHHARVRLDGLENLEVGDQVGFHISHPCTTFDNWRLVPTVDDGYTVNEATRCYL
jgi:D-serine dehydratase